MHEQLLPPIINRFLFIAHACIRGRFTFNKDEFDVHEFASKRKRERKVPLRVQSCVHSCVHIPQRIHTLLLRQTGQPNHA